MAGDYLKAKKNEQTKNLAAHFLILKANYNQLKPIKIIDCHRL